jgi:hypothetical protein
MWGQASGVQQQTAYLVEGEWIRGARRESRAEDSHQPKKCLDSKTTSSSSPWGDSVVRHTEKDSPYVAELRFHQVPSWFRWHVHSGGLNKKAL